VKTDGCERTGWGGVGGPSLSICPQCHIRPPPRPHTQISYPHTCLHSCAHSLLLVPSLLAVWCAGPGRPGAARSVRRRGRLRGARREQVGRRRAGGEQVGRRRTGRGRRPEVVKERTSSFIQSVFTRRQIGLYSLQATPSQPLFTPLILPFSLYDDPPASPSP
jgi:hypothetical protein